MKENQTMPNRSIMLGVVLSLVCFALLPKAPAAPETALPGFNTADGDHALAGVTTGIANTAVGWRSLVGDSTGGFNTGLGAGALALNNADANTAVGTAALLLNTTGTNNTAIGELAGSNLIDGEGNIYIGAQVQAGSTAELQFIRIGSDSAFAFPYDTYIAGIIDRTVDMATAVSVFVDGTGKLGTTPVDANGNKVAVPTPQAMLNELLKEHKKVEEQQASISQLKSEMQTMVAQLKEQAAQIQKVSAQLEMSKPAAKVVVNKP